MLEPNRPHPRNHMSANYLLTALALVTGVLLVVITILLSERPSKLHFPGSESTEKLQYIERHR